jgi:diguanylate cyclase (GGDEF)-like protein
LTILSAHAKIFLSVLFSHRESSLHMIRILLVEDNLEYSKAVQLILGEVSTEEFDLIHVTRIAEAMQQLDHGVFDVVLLDLNLPDSAGYETFASVHTYAPEIPVVVMSSEDDTALAVRTVREGAQDYLVKGEESLKPLTRAIHYAIERQKAQSRLQNLSLVDELTGVYNRRGFMTIAHQQSKLAQRTQSPWVIVFADVNELKKINDTYGHPEGDQVLREVARLLKSTFRESDVIARIGGDEFAVMAFAATEPVAKSFTRRLQTMVDTLNATPGRKYRLGISLGVAHYDPHNPRRVDEVLSQADAAMYEHKRKQKESPPA